MEIIPEAFSPLYPRAFIVINSLDSPDNMLTNNALYPWGTSVGKDKHGLSIGISIGSGSSNTKGLQSCSISQSSNYIRSGFLSNLLCIPEGQWVPLGLSPQGAVLGKGRSYFCTPKEWIGRCVSSRHAWCGSCGIWLLHHVDRLELMAHMINCHVISTFHKHLRSCVIILLKHSEL